MITTLILAEEHYTWPDVAFGIGAMLAFALVIWLCR